MSLELVPSQSLLCRLLPAALLAALLAPTAVSAQSCVLTRLDSPVLGAFDGEFTGEEQRWQASLGMRYGYSFRHFVGTDEQEERVEEHSQVVNNVSVLDLSLRYDVNARTTISVGIPYVSATRSGALRNEEREVVRRYTRSDTSGIGDVTVIGNWLVKDPQTAGSWNLSLGGGLKLPTGDYKQSETRISLVDGEEVESSGIADYSVQPGDGGWGLILEASGYGLIGKTGSFALYGTGTYILAPESTNGVDRPGAREGETEVSITDQYVARLGVQMGPASWRGWTLGLGGRIEGIPSHDLIGSSDGRRRPGYMLSAEPTVSWTRGTYSITFSMPWAVERNRQRSVSDVAFGTHGDAAFPDYIVLTNFSVRM